MVEPIMYFGIGFLVASLIGLVLVPLIHNRAVRLTKKRLQAAAPLSMAELQADKDHLRAEFAMSTRRLELQIDQLKAESAGQLAELGKKTDAINVFKIELTDKEAQIDALKANEAKLQDQFDATTVELSAKMHLLQESERLLASKDAEIAKLASDLNERALSNDSQRAEIAALRTQLYSFKDQIDEQRNKIEFAQKVEASLRSELTTAKRDVERRDVEKREPEMRQASSEILSTKDLVENAALRDRINEIAAEMARLTLALEGPRSPIETLLAATETSSATIAPRAGNGGGNGGGHNGGPKETGRERTLVERIRALQSKASRLASTS